MRTEYRPSYTEQALYSGISSSLLHLNLTTYTLHPFRCT
ncbi:hypothetical protein HMPREF0636_0402 [Porphyromonas catoniae ATCC 51270]|uniref:Uncharacterized protein n=1 Tax=Porphyromonas catoniae ATCC 51270 TaxID=887901 RepID=Z4WQM5_9PORP|nr:hypothetical protein HMPREF0636_0402 [Porphyromonas catoniae ATCC 51270]